MVFGVMPGRDSVELESHVSEHNDMQGRKKSLYLVIFVILTALAKLRAFSPEQKTSDEPNLKPR